MNKHTKPHPIWFYTQVAVDITDTIATVEDRDLVHHAHKVMRLKPADPVVLIDTYSGQRIDGELLHMGKSALSLAITHYSPAISPSKPHITLVLSVLKEQAWDWALQKAVELGVHTIVPISTQYSTVHVKDTHKKGERWQQIVRHAAQQCESPWLPKLETWQPLSRYLNSLTLDTNTLALVATERQGEPLSDCLQKYPAVEHIIACIGPEGGWHNDELSTFTQCGFHLVSLGDRILRSDTACCTLMSCLRYAYTR